MSSKVYHFYSGRPCSVLELGPVNERGKQRFALSWKTDDGGRRGQHFYAKIRDIVPDYDGGEMKCERCGDDDSDGPGACSCGLVGGPQPEFTDTQRLDFLLQFLSVEDLGDDSVVLGVQVDAEAAEEKIGFGPVDPKGRRSATVLGWGDDLRTIIDRAIKAHGGAR